MIIYTARVHTDSGDTYVWAYKDEPTREQVIQKLFEWEGEAADIEWYEATTSIFIERTELQ